MAGALERGTRAEEKRLNERPPATVSDPATVLDAIVFFSACGPNEPSLTPGRVAPRPQYWLIVSRGAGCYVFGDTWTKYSYYAYSKPYTRVPAHLVGMAFGFLNERWISDESRRPRVTAPALRSTLAAAAVGLLACVFGPLSDYTNAESWPPWLNGAFLTLCRPVWAAGLGVVATACALGRAPRIDAFLAAPAWTPLARLTFGAYLMHPVVIKWFAGTATASYHFSPHYMVSCALLNATCAFALAAALWLVVERPTMNAASASRTRARER